MEQNNQTLIEQSSTSILTKKDFCYIVLIFLTIVAHLLISLILQQKFLREVQQVKKLKVKSDQKNPDNSTNSQIDSQTENEKKFTSQQQTQIQILVDSVLKNKIEILLFQKFKDFQDKSDELRKQQDQQNQQFQNQINQLQNPIDQQQIAEQDQKILNLQNQIDQLQNLIEQQSQDFKKTILNQNNIIAQQSQKLQEQQSTIVDSKQQISILSNTQVKFEEQLQLENKKIEDTFKEVTSIKNELLQISEQIKNSQKKNDLNFDQLNQAIKKISTENQNNEKLKQKTIVQDLYDLTIKQRHVEPQFKSFVNDELTQEDLVLEYGMGNIKCKKTLKQDLRGMRRVRGDGNCFYTSFVFQYLEKILVKENDLEFDNFIKITKSLKFQIRYKDKEFQENQLKEVQTQFIEQCQKIRQQDQDTRLDTLCQLFKDDECEFYGQSIIFLRSLVFKICDNQQQRELFQAQGLNLEQQVLEWEYDCESNEPIINELSKYLKISTIFYFCDSENKTIIVNKFNAEIENPKYTLYLLFRPGHYSIGLPINK